MADITAIRRAIADNILDVYGPGGEFEDDGMTVTATIESPPQAPAIQVMKGPTNYDEAMQGALLKLTFFVRVYLAMPADEALQELLDDMLSFDPARPARSRSLKQAIEKIPDPSTTTQVTLGGLVADLTVTDDTGHRIYTVGGHEYVGAQWEMEVYA